ncbi:MAG: DUF2080 family transposase-associated protein, partial [Nanoarchaeota archaeon]
KVTEIGNGAHVFAPREWLNDEVIIVRTPRMNPKEEIIKVLGPYLDKVIAVFLYGSYARGEQERDSDIDVLVISREKFSVKSKNMEIVVIPESRIKSAIKLNPLLFYSMLNDALPIINSFYFEKLKQEKIDFSLFNEVIEDTKGSLNSSQKIMDMDYRLKSKLASESVVYSLILRLRGLFIIDILLKNKRYSKQSFKNWLVTNSNVDYEKVYNIYRAVRDNKKVAEKVPIEQAESLIELLFKEIKRLEGKIK